MALQALAAWQRSANPPPHADTTALRAVLGNSIAWFIRLGHTLEHDGLALARALLRLEASGDLRALPACDYRTWRVQATLLNLCTALDAPLLLPDLLAAAPRMAGRPGFARTMRSITRHTFGSDEADRDADRWVAWLDATYGRRRH